MNIIISNDHAGVELKNAVKIFLKEKGYVIKDVGDNSTLTYINPLIRVVQTSDVQEYSLGTNNLYTFSLNLEEAQP